MNLHKSAQISGHASGSPCLPAGRDAPYFLATVGWSEAVFHIRDRAGGIAPYFADVDTGHWRLRHGLGLRPFTTDLTLAPVAIRSRISGLPTLWRSAGAGDYNGTQESMGNGVKGIKCVPPDPMVLVPCCILHANFLW